MRCAACTLLAVAAWILGGCGALGVETFSGSYIALALDWPIPMGMSQPMLPDPSSQHFELWAQLSGSRLIRLSPEKQKDPGVDPFPGFDVRWALDPNEPCIIRALDPLDPGNCSGADPSRAVPPDSECGEHLLSLDAQLDPGSAPALQQMALAEHVRSVVPASTTFNAIAATPMVTGEAPQPLLVLVRHDPVTQVPALTPANAGKGADAQTRRQACPDQHPLQCPNTQSAPCPFRPSYYVGNPRQFTKPLNGVLYGFFNFQTPLDPNNPNLPPQNLGGIALPIPTALDDLQQLFFTIENNGPPPIVPSASIAFIGTRLPDSTAGRGTVHLAIILPQPTGAPKLLGTGSVLIDLDQGLD